MSEKDVANLAEKLKDLKTASDNLTENLSTLIQLVGDLLLRVKSLEDKINKK